MSQQNLQQNQTPRLHPETVLYHGPSTQIPEAHHFSERHRGAYLVRLSSSEGTRPEDVLRPGQLFDAQVAGQILFSVAAGSEVLRNTMFS